MQHSIKTTPHKPMTLDQCLKRGPYGYTIRYQYSTIASSTTHMFFDGETVTAMGPKVAYGTFKDPIVQGHGYAGLKSQVYPDGIIIWIRRSYEEYQLRIWKYHLLTQMRDARDCQSYEYGNYDDFYWSAVLEHCIPLDRLNWYEDSTIEAYKDIGR